MAGRSGVYAIRNRTDGKVYVGSSENTRRRLWYHRWLLKRGAHHAIHLQRAWDRDGAAAFTFEVIEDVPDLALLIEREQYWIDRHGSAHERRGYNVAPAAGTRRGVPQPASVAEKMRTVHTGKPKSAEQRAKMSAAMKGRVKSESHRQKLREAAQRQYSDPKAREAAAEFAHRGWAKRRGKRTP